MVLFCERYCPGWHRSKTLQGLPTLSLWVHSISFFSRLFVTPFSMSRPTRNNPSARKMCLQHIAHQVSWPFYLSISDLLSGCVFVFLPPIFSAWAGTRYRTPVSSMTPENSDTEPQPQSPLPPISVQKLSIKLDIYIAYQNLSEKICQVI